MPSKEGGRQGRRTVKRIEIGKLPELQTRVAMFGSAKQKEVGGGACAVIVVALISG
jgi:hypothetical protein